MLSSSSSSESSSSNFKLWCLYFFLDAAFGNLFHKILLVPARLIAHRLPGAVVPPLNEEEKLVQQEMSSNDTTLEWPSADAISKLPLDWVIVWSGHENKEKETHHVHERNIASKASKKKRIASKKKRSSSSSQQASDAMNNNCAATKNEDVHQPFYLNHVRGSTRIRQASQRVSAALGTVLSTYMLCYLSSSITLVDLGLTNITSTHTTVGRDLVWGFLIGSSIVIIIFIMEVLLGWIKIVGFFQTVVKNESFSINFLWDVLFHIGVSINEEVMLRGWMFTLGCRGILGMALNRLEKSSSTTTLVTLSIIASIILQSSLFSFLHLHSPGSTYVSLLNLFLGGVAASINVMVGGGSLWLGIGWHFGWNIFMGHILGRSTSGIPSSCACIDVVPCPKASYKHLHGGTFGPEQGVLAPLAYVLGILLVIHIYGYDGMIVWRDRMVSTQSF